MAKYSVHEIAGILGEDSRNLHDAEVSVLLTDSRSLAYPGESLFFAIRTASNDGHKYIPSLYRSGVRNFVVEHLPEDVPADANFIRVDNTTGALQKIAAYHRHRFRLPVIGITGSRGKTTVKEWLYQLLREDYRIVRSPRSYNSQIGVPLSVWDIDEATELAIIEAGISCSDEMEALEKIVSPTVTVVTNVGSEHDEGFSSVAEKCMEKLRLSRESDCVIYCSDDRTVSNGIISLAYGRQEMGWSKTSTSAPLFISSVVRKPAATDIQFSYLLCDGVISIPFTEDCDIQNAVTCLAVLLYFRVPLEKIKERFSRLAPAGTRMDVAEGANGCLLIYDTYTCDFLSLDPSIDFMRRRTTANRRCTVILSDVLEENLPSDELYRKIAELLRLRGVDRFVGIGAEMCRNRDVFAPGSEFFGSVEEFLEARMAADFSNELILLKGAPEFRFDRIYEMLEARQHETVLEVNLDALVHNFNFYRAHLRPDTKIACMLKASGYGAGSYELAKTLQSQGAAYIAVAAHDEGVALREAGIVMPIMVLNPKVENYRTLFSYRLEPEIYSFEVLREIVREAEKFGVEGYPVHIKIDSGMHRLGFIYEELPEVAAFLKGQRQVRPASVFSHLATADDFGKTDYAMMQLGYFRHCCDCFLPEFGFPVMRHILNTDGILRFPESQYEMVRLGIGLYGVPTLGDGFDSALRPVSSLHSVVIQIREWEAGTAVGYGGCSVLARHSRIATIPIGYADGFSRRLGCGVGQVWIGGKRVPTVGNICMDLFMADVTDVDCRVGDKVEIFGRHIPVSEIAEKTGTIPYEVLTSVSERVKRIYYRE